MANIQTLLAKILSAIYGEEVRGAIHDSIEAINDEVEAWTELQDGTVTTAKLASNAVTTAKIADGAITRAKLNADVVDTTLAVSGAPADAKKVGDEVSDLKTKLNPYDTTAYYRSLFERKKLGASVGSRVNPSDATNRLAIVALQYAENDVTVSVDTGYQFGILTCDSSDILISDSGWKTVPTTITAGTYFHISMRKSDNSEIILSDVSHIYLSGEGLPVMDARFDNIEDELGTLSPYKSVNYYRTIFVQKRWNGTKFVDSGTYHRLSIADTQYTKTGGTVKTDTGYQFALYLFQSDGTFISDSGWITTATIPAGSYWCLSFRKSDDGEVSESDLVNITISISDFTLNVVMINKNIDNLSTAISEVASNINDIQTSHKYTFASLLMGSNGYINYDTVNGTITIPKDSIYFEYKANGNATYKVLNNSSAIVLNGITYESLGTSAIKLVLDVTTWVFSVITYTTALTANQRLIATLRLKSGSYVPNLATPSPWSIDGKPYGVTVPDVSVFVKSVSFINSVNHRGWYQAPENTIPAYKLSKQKGFKLVETDVQFTSDGVPVLLHDATINRTARNEDGSSISNTVNIADITYEQALSYDFGIYKGSEYAGTPIPKLEDFIKLCRNLGLIPYIELKADATYTQAQITGLVDIVNRNGMRDNVVWISKSSTYLGYVKNYDSKARLGLVLVLDVTSANITTLENLKTADNSVFADVDYTKLTSAGVSLCYNADIPLEVWTVDTSSDVLALDPYITGVTSDNIIASEVLYNANV